VTLQHKQVGGAFFAGARLSLDGADGGAGGAVAPTMCGYSCAGGECGGIGLRGRRGEQARKRVPSVAYAVNWP
jgi:hypothetical protein